MAAHKFLGEDVELKEYSISDAEAIEAVLMNGDVGLSDAINGTSETTIKAYKASQKLAVELGTVREDITVDYLLSLPASKSDEVVSLYEAVMDLNRTDEEKAEIAKAMEAAREKAER